MRQMIIMLVLISSMLGLTKWSVIQKELANQTQSKNDNSANYNELAVINNMNDDDDDEKNEKEIDGDKDNNDNNSIEETDNNENEEKELTLEKLFPEKSFFGPTARATSFSCDGKYAAYMYRPYIERRHGSDLWIYNVETGQNQRITSVSVMSKFQQATRKVKEDRIEKNRKKKIRPR